MSAATHISSTSSGASAALSTVVTIPAGATTGRLILLIVGQAVASTISVPTGWNAGPFSASTRTMRCFWKIAQSGDAGSNVTITSGTSAVWIRQVSIYSGIDPTTPVGTGGATSSSMASTTLTAPSFTAPVANTIFFAFYGATALSTSTYTPQASMTERSNNWGQGSLRAGSAEEIVGAGATGTRSVAISDSTSASTILSIPIHPVPSAGDTQAPTVPGTPTVTTTNQQTTVSWAASTDDTGVTQYNIKRSTTAGGTYTTIGTRTGTPPTTSFVDTTAVVGQQYFYRVSAQDAANNVSADSNASAGHTVPDQTAPSVPTNVQATSVPHPVVTWNASTDNVGGGVRQYNIKRSATLNGTYSTIGNVTGNPPALTYTDTSAVAGATYYYKVSAQDIVPNVSADSAASNVVNVPTKRVLASTVSGLATATGTLRVRRRLASTVAGSASTSALLNKITTTEKGVVFDGINDHITIPNHVALNTGTSYPYKTILGWIQTGPDVTTYQVIYDEGGFSNGYGTYIVDGFLYHLGWSDTNVWSHPDNAAWGTVAWVRHPVQPNTIYRTAVTLNADTSDILGYVNGVLWQARKGAGVMPSHTNASAIGQVVGTSRTLVGSPAAGNFFKGFIGFWRTFNRVLPQSEINSTKDSPATGSESNLVFAYNLDESSGTQATDVSPNAIHGTLVGGPVRGVVGPAQAPSIPLSASSIGSATASGTLRVRKPLASAVAGSATASGTLRVRKPLAGVAAGSASALGTLYTEVPVVKLNPSGLVSAEGLTDNGSGWMVS